MQVEIKKTSQVKFQDFSVELKMKKTPSNYTNYFIDNENLK